MLQLQVVSDIHLERLAKIPNIPVAGKNIALLGDIGKPHTSIYQDFIKLCSKNYENVFLIAGNHEYHGHTLTALDCFLDNFSKEFKNVHYLQNSHVDIMGYKIVGSTLWSKISPDIFEGMYGKSIKTSIEEIYRVHHKSVQYITKELQYNKPAIVLTHHCPIYNYKVAGKYYGHPLNSAFFNNLDYLLKKPLIAWGWGHLHYNNPHYHITPNGWTIELMNNQLGNPNKDIRFNPYYCKVFRALKYFR